jgi:hypothetical protein
MFHNTKQNNITQLNRSFIAGSLSIALLASCPIMTFGQAVVGCGTPSDMNPTPVITPVVSSVINNPIIVNTPASAPVSTSATSLGNKTVASLKAPNAASAPAFSSNSTSLSVITNTGLAKSLANATSGSTTVRSTANSTIVFSGNATNTGISSSNVSIASNGNVSFAPTPSASNAPMVGAPLAYKASSFSEDLKDTIVSDIKNGKLSGSGTGASGNIDDITFRKIADQFKKSASTKSWEEVSSELTAEGYDVNGTIEDSFETNLTSEQKAKITVKGSWKEFYSKLQAEAKQKAIADAENAAKRAQEDAKRVAQKQAEEDAFNKLPESEKQKILAERERERQEGIGRQQEREKAERLKQEEEQRRWAALPPEEKARIIAEDEARHKAEQARNDEENAQREKMELEKYRNEYFYSWNADLYNIPGQVTAPETSKSQETSGPVVVGFTPVPKPQDTLLRADTGTPKGVIAGAAATVINLLGTSVPAALSSILSFAPNVLHLANTPLMAALPDVPTFAVPTFYKPGSLPASVPAKTPALATADSPSFATPVFYKGTPNSSEEDNASVGKPVFYKGMW